MTILNTIALVAWLLAGILTLLVYSNQQGVSKTLYVLCWVSLLSHIIGSFIQ